MLSPIVLFTYNRYEHTKKTIEALKDNILATESDLYIFVDYTEDEHSRCCLKPMYEYIDSVNNKGWFKNVKVIYAKTHKGLANSVISGVTGIINTFGKAIVLEDDIVTVPSFLQYMNEALDYYSNKKSVWSISGYAIPDKRIMSCEKSLYLSRRADSWGWATWKDRWDSIDWSVSDYKAFKWNLFKRIAFNKGGEDLSFMLDRQMRGDIDSWAVRWCYNQYKQKKYTVYPVESYVKNIGFDGSGTHFSVAEERPVACKADSVPEFEEIVLDKRILKDYQLYNSGKSINRIKRMVVCLLYNMGLYKVNKGRNS